MGNDGGSIPKRRELVKEAARLPTSSEVKESQQEQQQYAWTTCVISRRPLKAPIVSDSAGKLYNKDAVLEYLLPSDDPATDTAKADADKIFQGRVKSLRDVVEVKFHVEKDERTCPLSNKTLGPNVKTVYVVPCGHAFAEVALEQLSNESCPECGEAYDRNDIIHILPLEPIKVDRLAKRAESLLGKGLTHSLKKIPGSKKRKIRGDATTFEPETSKPSKLDSDSRSAPKSKTSASTLSTAIQNPATASLTAKILAEQEEKAKRRKLDPNENLKALFSTGKGSNIKDGDFMTRGFSIPAATK